jgi:RNA polymerase sigma-70 factor (ECF subfamily)
MKEADPVQEALKRAQRGDPDAYGVAVAAYQARLRSFIAGYVPKAEWVDDLAQQAFVSAYQGLAGFQIGTDFYAWLKSIAYNHLRAELERTNRRRRLEKEYLLELGAGELQRRLERDEESVDALRDCVRLLSGAARELIQGYYGEGLSLSVIGTKLGRKADSLKVSLFKIRARLKECIEGKRAGMGETAIN